MEIVKPITVVRDDFIVSLTNVINNSGLPPFIIEPILKEMYLQTKDMAKRQLELDRIKYENELTENEMKE